jgi:toxin FitB
MFLLDTNVVSELRKVRLGKADRGVARWADGVDAGALLRTWFEALVLPEFQGRILPVDATVALRCGRLHVPDPRAERDALIAATARVHRLTVVTRNRGDFESMGVALLNPWTL